jgi:hypothetical protein
VYAGFEDELTAKVTYLFIHYKILPQPEKSKQKEEEDKKEEEKEEKQQENDTISKIKGIIKQKGLSGFLDIIKEFVSIGTGSAKKLFSHIIINNISVDIAVADEDAAQAAIFYGYTCSVVYPAMALLVNNMKCKKYHIHINADFNENESKVQFKIKAQIQLLFIFSSALPAFFKSLKVFKEARISPANKKTTE